MSAPRVEPRRPQVGDEVEVAHGRSWLIGKVDSTWPLGFYATSTALYTKTAGCYWYFVADRDCTWRWPSKETP